MSACRSSLRKTCGPGRVVDPDYAEASRCRCAWITPTPYLSSNKLPELSILHSGPNATRHVPRSVAGARHAHSIDFPRADAALVSEGEMDHSEPGPERRIRTFKHGADRN